MTKAEVIAALEPFPDDATVFVAEPSGDDVRELDFVAPYPSDSHGAAIDDSGKEGEESVSDIVLWADWE